MMNLSIVPDYCLKMHCNTLIIRNESIERAYNSIQEFTTKNNLYGVTNGELFLIFQMVSPSDFFNHLYDSVFEPNQILFDQDLISATEVYPGTGYEPIEERLIGKPHPYLNVNWLQSIIRADGNWICLKKTYSESFLNSQWQIYIEREYPECMNDNFKTSFVSGKSEGFILESEYRKLFVDLMEVMVSNQQVLNY